MLNKLAFRNAKRSLNDYLLYFITMVLVTALMLSFNSLLFSESIQTLWDGGGFYTAMLILVTIFIVFIMVWLVHYMVRFMAKKRSREFGTYLLFGFEKAQVAHLFFRENLLIGLAAFFVGIFPGLFLQQLLMKLLYVIVDENYFVRFDLNKNTLIMTAAVYCFSYLLALIGNGRQLKKMNIAVMMQQERKNDELSNTYGGNFAFVKTYQDLTENEDIDQSIIKRVLRIIYEEIANFYDTDIFLVQGKKNFVDSVKQKITIKLFQEGLFEKISSIYDQMLNDLYKNIQLYK